MWVFIVKFFPLYRMCEKFYNKMLGAKTYEQGSSKVSRRLPGVPVINSLSCWPLGSSRPFSGQG